MIEEDAEAEEREEDSCDGGVKVTAGRGGRPGVIGGRTKPRREGLVILRRRPEEESEDEEDDAEDRYDTDDTDDTEDSEDRAGRERDEAAPALRTPAARDSIFAGNI